MRRCSLALVLVAAHGCTGASSAPPAPAAPASESADAGTKEGGLEAALSEAARGCDAGAAGAACPEVTSASMYGAGAPSGDDGEIDDGFDSDDFDSEGPPEAPKTPAITLSDQEITERLRRDPASLGSMSVGKANAGALVNGVQMPKGERWQLIDAPNAWGTRETIDDLVRSINKVNEQFPSAPPLLIGHISGKHGGYLSPHKSHQSGRDVDIGYYYRTASPRWFAWATADNLDFDKTWALLKAAITGGLVEMIFIDSSIQRLLSDYAAKHSEDEAWLDTIFQVRSKSQRPIIRHVKGHATHIHIRFFNPLAQDLGRRAHVHLASSTLLPAFTYVPHKARNGDTLVTLARRYGTTVQAIQQANGLKSIALRAGVVYKIPQKAPLKPKAPAAPAKRPPPAKTPASPAASPPRGAPR
jgi:murein endopeptidase